MRAPVEAVGFAEREANELSGKRRRATMHWTRIPTGPQWRETVAAVPDAPEVDRDRLEAIARLLDRARAMEEFDRVPIVGSILRLLSEWDDLFPHPSGLRPYMQGLWNVSLAAIQRSVVHLYVSEYTAISDLVRYRYVTFQHMDSSIALLIHHPLTRVTGAAHLHERSNLAGAVGQLAKAIEERLPGIWTGGEMWAFLSGGNEATPQSAVDALASALASIGIGVHHPVFFRRQGAQAPLHMVFDRLIGRFAPFMPALDPVALGLRERGDQNRSIARLQEPVPTLLQHVPGAR